MADPTPSVIPVQQRGMTSAQLQNYVGPIREIVWNTDTHRAHYQDGVTPGGWPLRLLADTTAGEILYTPQVLDTAKRAQGRANIGAGRFENDAYQNLLINPRFRVRQFAPPAVQVNNSLAYVCDGWYFGTGSLSGSAGIATRSPSVVFSNRPDLSFGIFAACGIAKPSLGATDFANIIQPIQAYRTEDLRFGTALAKPMALAFTYRTNLNTTFGAVLRNDTSNRSLIHDVQAVSGVDSFIAIPILPDTQGTWASGPGVGMRLSFTMACGSQYVANAADTWLAGNFLGTANTGNMFANVGNQLTIGDVILMPIDDLSAGATAQFTTDRLQMFRRQYEDELRACRRFFRKSYNQADMPGAITSGGAIAASMIGFAPSGNIQAGFPLPLEEVMATTPTLTIYSPATGAPGKARDLIANADCTAFYGTIGDSLSSLIFQTATASAFNIQAQFTLDSRLI